VKKLWTVIRKKMGIDLRVHDLRHVFATMALEAGVPACRLITIAPLRGHAPPSMTVRYANVLTGCCATEKAGKLLDRFRSRIANPRLGGGEN
jgi:integrase